MGAAILDLTSWGPPSWIGSDVKNSIVGPILLQPKKFMVYGLVGILLILFKPMELSIKLRDDRSVTGYNFQKNITLLSLKINFV